MYVYLNSSGLIKRFQGVGLSEYFVPHVDGVLLEGARPGLWFKALAVDSLFVDCDGKEVYWSKAPPTDGLRFHEIKVINLTLDEMLVFYRTKERLFGKGLHDFDVHVAELFEAANSIVNGSDPDHQKHICIKKDVLRMLHLFILPKLKLRTSSLGDTKSTLDYLEQEEGALQRKAERAETTRIATEKSLLEQRTKILSRKHLTSMHYVSTCSLTFLELFLEHLHKDIHEYTDKMLCLENHITPLRNCKGEQEALNLTDFREERNNALVYLNDAVLTRETIKNVIGRAHVSKKIRLCETPNVHPSHIVYIETQCRYEKVNHEINQLNQAKLNLDSLKKATKYALSEIKEKGESYGSSMSFIENNRSGDLMTLSERVAELSQSVIFGTPNTCRLFVKQTIANCILLAEDSMANGHSIRDDIQHISKSESKLSEISKALERTEILKSNAKKICDEVVKHLSETSNTIAAILYQKPADRICESQKRNVYICHESLCSKEIMPHLQNLYEHCYNKSFQDATQTLKISPSIGIETSPILQKSSYPDAVDGTTPVVENTTISSDALSKFKKQIRKGVGATSVFRKLKYFAKAIQQMTTHPSGTNGPFCTDVDINADEILNLLTVLLKKLDTKLFQKLFANIHLVDHLRPSFVDGGPHHYSTVSFYAALHHVIATP